MIRVNLLAPARDVSTVVDTRRRLAAPITAAVLAAGCVALAGWWSWSLQQEGAALTRAQADAEAALAGLRPAVEALRAAEVQQAGLAARVALVEGLHRGRGAPARLLDRLSRALPDGLWLSEVREEPVGVVVRGHAGTLAAVSDYAAALEASAAPGARVEIVDSAREPRSGGPPTVAFEVRMPLPLPFAAGEER